MTALAIAAVFLVAAFFSDYLDPRVRAWRQHRGEVALARSRELPAKGWER